MRQIIGAVILLGWGPAALFAQGNYEVRTASGSQTLDLRAPPTNREQHETVESPLRNLRKLGRGSDYSFGNPFGTA